MFVFSLTYLMEVSITLFCCTFRTITLSVSSLKPFTGKTHLPFEIDLNKPASIEDESASTPLVSSGEVGKIETKKLSQREIAHEKKKERDRRYKAKFTRTKMKAMIPLLKDEERNKIIIRLQNRRTSERARQQKQRDELKERIKNNQLTEKDLILLKKEKKRNQQKYQIGKAKMKGLNDGNTISSEGN